MTGAYVTLTKVGGGAFKLTSFDWANNGSGFTASATGYSALSLAGYSSGSENPNWTGTSITFSNSNYSNNQLDNIVLSAAGVPEPASWALMIGGFGLAGAAMRRRRSVSVRYA